VVQGVEAERFDNHNPRLRTLPLSSDVRLDLRGGDCEVADLLHVSPKTVSRWTKEGKLPFLKTLGGHRRYPEAEIRDLAEGLREEATA
jgi:excisionase family DNA binding protein